jgi:hypothetical protein
LPRVGAVLTVYVYVCVCVVRAQDKSSLMAALRPKKKSSVFGPDGRPLKR